MGTWLAIMASTAQRLVDFAVPFAPADVGDSVAGSGDRQAVAAVATPIVPTHRASSQPYVLILMNQGIVDSRETASAIRLLHPWLSRSGFETHRSARQSAMYSNVALLDEAGIGGSAFR